MLRNGRKISSYNGRYSVAAVVQRHRKCIFYALHVIMQQTAQARILVRPWSSYKLQTSPPAREGASHEHTRKRLTVIIRVRNWQTLVEIFASSVPSSGMLRRATLERTDVSEERLTASIVSVTRINWLGTTLALIINRSTVPKKNIIIYIEWYFFAAGFRC
jgi:hypothetical protein